MEKGSFHSRLAQLEFLEQSKEQQTFEKNTFTTKYATQDALLRQNEDLSARLSSAMARLLQYEKDAEENNQDFRSLQKINESLQDQLHIWKEKERIWLEKLEKANYQIQELESRYPEYQNLKLELNRYKKYHEKIRTQIKPYIQQLKDYSKELLDQIKELNRENLNQKYEFNKSQTKCQDLQSELSSRVTSHTLALDEMNNLHLQETNSLKNEILRLKETSAILEIRSNRLDACLSRQDEIENLNVALKRSLDEMELKLIHETEGLRNSLQMARNDLVRKNLEIEQIKTQGSYSPKLDI